MIMCVWRNQKIAIETKRRGEDAGVGQDNQREMLITNPSQ